MAAARINQREKCALIRGNSDIGGLRSPRSEGLSRKLRKIPPEFARGGPYGYDLARNRVSSGEYRVSRLLKNALLLSL